MIAVSRTRSGWGNFPRIHTRALAFDSEADLGAIVAGGRELIAHGNGRSYGDSALGSSIIEVRPHGFFLGFDADRGFLHVQAGVMLSEILEVFVPRGWFLSITPGTKLITVGGAIASDVHGKNHHVAGCFSSCVERFRLMLPGGRIALCSRQENADLFRATCGGMGLTGVILDAVIGLQPIPSAFIDQVTVRTRNLEETFEAFEEHGKSSYSVAWIDCLARGEKLGQCLLMTGEFSPEGGLDYRSGRGVGVPFYFPSRVLNTTTVKAFNRFYHGRVKERVSRQRVGIDGFFYPLDAIDHWNRIYGKDGFTQYQFVLPAKESFQGLKEILEMLAWAGKGSFLAVLKSCGPGNDNYLSFPMQGYSLALDFRIEDGVFGLLDRLDERVVHYGGRIYLTKDVRMGRQVFEAGYPELDAFRALRKAYGMDKVFNSLQSRRLGL
ncbi:MAG: FAD-binding oxidoreductase [Pseudomonadota bacterium]